jgi:hypothetical protein
MARVHVRQLSIAERSIPQKWRPHHPPIFELGTGPPTRTDYELAIALIDALDDESRTWYGGTAALERMREHLGDA